MNVEIGVEATQFPEKEYINGIFVAGHSTPISIPNGKKLYILIPLSPSHIMYEYVQTIPPLSVPQ
jgi:hypothetical protein